MNIYNDFNSMLNAQTNTRRDLSVFNEVEYVSNLGEFEPGTPIGCFDVSIGNNDYLCVYCYGTNDIKNAEEGGYAYSPSGWSGIQFYDTYALSKYSYHFEDVDCEDLYQQIIGIAQKYTRMPIEEQYDSHDIDFDRMLSKTEARQLARKIDALIDEFVERNL